MNEASPTTKPGKWTTRLVYTAIVIIVLSLIAGQLGDQIGLQPFIPMLGLMIAILLGFIAFIIVLVSLLRKKATLTAVSWIAVGFGVLAIYKIVGMAGAGNHPIHDVTTDTQNPPEFIKVVELRKEGENTTSYLDDGTAEKQLELYPDIETIILNEDVATAYARALNAANSMGWEIIADVPEEGRIEATASTTFVGFKDDVVIRVKARGTNTAVDVRSKSRIGRGDMGVNADRIRAYGKILSQP
ncbi:MAG: DUF1499 domain-containing protein [Gammaproteobacteria bacterium]